MKESNISRIYLTTLISIIVIFLFADQNLMAPNLSLIAKDFNFNNKERDEKLGGNIAFGFFVLGAPAALIVGLLTDSVNRCILLGLVVLLGESACLGTFWVTTYQQLFFCRVLTGISIGGSTPIIFSLLADLYTEDTRIFMSTIIGICMSGGIAGGQLLAGLLGPTFGWRLPFLLISVPSIVLGLLVISTGKEPTRGSCEESVQRVINNSENQFPTSNSLDAVSSSYYQARDFNNINNGKNPLTNIITYSFEDESKGSSHYVNVNDGSFGENQPDLLKNINTDYQVSELSNSSTLQYSEKLSCKKLLILFSTPSFVLIILQGLPGCVPWGLIYVFLNDYFSSDRNLSIEKSTFALFLFAIGGFFGQLIGGSLGQYLYLKDKRFQIWLMGISTILSVFPMIYLLNTHSGATTLFYSMAFFSGGLVSVNGPNVRTVLQNVCAPEVRGSAFAVFMLSDDIGKGLGPVFIVQLLQACNGDRTKAFNIAIYFWIFCGVILLMLTFTVIQDEINVQNKILLSMKNVAKQQQLSQDAKALQYNELHVTADLANPQCLENNSVSVTLSPSLFTESAVTISIDSKDQTSSSHPQISIGIDVHKRVDKSDLQEKFE